MSKLKQKHKDYLIKNEIKDLTDLVTFTEIQRNTKNLNQEDIQMLFDFVWLILHEESELKSFFAEKKSKNTPFYLDETLSQDEKEKKVIEDWNKNDLFLGQLPKGRIFNYNPDKEEGKKESQTVKKAPVFTYCKQMKNAIEKLALRSLYGHEKYEKGDDWENFSRVPNAEFEYSNSMFRHALEIGEEDELQHLIAQAWNSVARLEIYLRNKS